MLYLNKYKERATPVRIQSRWVVLILFLICFFGVLIGLHQYRRTKIADLSNPEINDIKLNEKFDKKSYEVDKKIKFDRFRFYNSKAHPDLTIKMREKDSIVKGMMLVRDKKVHTNFDGGIDSLIDNAVENLESGYRRTKVSNGFSSVRYIGRDDHLRLNLLYQDLEIKHIEFFSK